MLTSAELTGLRETLDASLPDTCTISRPGFVSDGAGGQTATWTTIATVACRVSPEMGRDSESEQADRETAVKDWVITLSDGTDVTSKDRIVSAGASYEVMAVDGPRTWEISRRVHCQRAS